MGSGGDGYVGTGVDEEFCGGVLEVFKDAACEGCERSGGQVFFAKLNIVDAVGSPECGLVDKGGDLWLPPIAMRLRWMGHPSCIDWEVSSQQWFREHASVGDGVAAHGCKCMGIEVFWCDQRSLEG